MEPVIIIGSLALDWVHVVLIISLCLISAAAIWLRSEARQSNEKLALELENETEKRGEVEMELGRFEQKLEAEQSRTRDAELKLAAAEARREEDEKRFNEIAHNAVRQSQRDFLERADDRFKQMYKPIGENFEAFKKRVDAIEKVRTEDKTALQQQVKHIAESLQHNSKATAQLVTALSAPKGGGRWGEMTLRNVMEQAGLSSHCDFNEQVNDQTETGRQRPDAVIHLPGERQIVVDAKVSIEAYLKASDTSDSAERAALLKTHAANVQRHVRALASKAYQANLSERVDFVAMFIPGENFFAAALEHAPGLLEDAYSKGVIVTTPSTLIGLAKTVSYVWRQEKMAENAREAAALGEQLYDALVTMTSHVEKMGKGLKGAVNGYDAFIGSLQRNVLPKARKFEELEVAKPSKAIPVMEKLEHEPRALELDLQPQNKADEAA